MNVKHYFLPNAENDYTPHLLQRTAMMGMFVMILLSFAAVNMQALFWQSSQWLVGTVLPAVVVNLTNTERTELSAPILTRSALLDEAARLKAEDMAKKHYFAHYSPEGVSPWYWFDQVSYRYAHAGENLAIHFKDSGAVVAAWMNSPTHRANIANSLYTEIGVGTAKGTFEGYDTVFVVQLFGTPAVPLLSTPEPTSAVVRKMELGALEEPVLVAAEDRAQVAGEEDTQILLIDTEQSLPKPVAPEEVETTPVAPVAVVTPVAPAPEEALEVAEVYTDEAQTSVFSTHYATSSGLAPAAIGSVSGTTAAAHLSFIDSIATRPSATLQILYLTIGLLVSTLLLVSIVLGFYNARPLQVVYGVGLLLLMSGLFYLHTSLTTSVVVAAGPDSVYINTPL